MIALDTDVLARFVIHDGPFETAKAIRAIPKLTLKAPGTLPAVVLPELVWVLQPSYRIFRPDCGETLKPILSTTSIGIEHSKLCWSALRVFRMEKADLSDFFIHEFDAASDYSEVFPLDNAALKSPGFTTPK